MEKECYEGEVLQYWKTGYKPIIIFHVPYGEVCLFASTLYKYDLRKGDIFVLRWTRV